MQPGDPSTSAADDHERSGSEPAPLDAPADGLVALDPHGAVAPLEAPVIGRSSIRRNVAHLLTSQAVTWVLAFVLSAVQLRVLGPDTQGQLRLGFSLWTIAGVVIAFGTSTHLTLRIARSGPSALRLIGPVMWLRVALFAIAMSLFLVGAVVLGSESELIWVLVLFGIATLLATAIDVYSSAFAGLERFAVPATVTVIVKVLLTVASITVLLIGFGALGVLIVAIAANFVGVLYIARALGRIARVPLDVGVGSWVGIARAGSSFLMAGAVLTLYQQIDTVVISVFVDKQTLGWYSAADGLFGSLLFVPTILCGSLLPVLGRLHGTDDVELVRLVRRTFSTLGLVVMPIGLGTVAIAGNVVVTIFGDDYRESGTVLSVLGVVMILTTASVLFGTLAVSTGRQRFWNTIMFGCVLLTIPLDLVLVPWARDEHGNGAIGGALAYVVTELVMLVVGLWKIAPYLCSREVVWRSARLLLAGGVMVAAIWPMRHDFLALPIAAGAVVYVIAVLALRLLTEAEWDMIRRITGRLGVRFGRA